MALTEVTLDNGIATITLARGKVNALNEAGVEELSERLHELERDPKARAVVLTGRGAFFSFGFDIPGFLDYDMDAFAGYLTKFTGLCQTLFLYPKPAVAAINGHAVAGGCMLATACDRRVMASGKARISLNEITFGASVFAGATEMLRYCVGSGNAQEILYSGAMYSAEQALKLSLVDEVTTSDAVLSLARDAAAGMAARGLAFSSIKGLLRRPVADAFRDREADSVREFVEIWYSEATWANLQKIEIRS